MQNKCPLYTGLTLLAIGIILKSTTSYSAAALLVMLAGVAFKIYYITAKVIRKEYKPGYELLVLISGLAIFLTGLLLTKHGLLHTAASITFKITGISLKAAFVLLFMLKTRGTNPAKKPAMANK
ncbi:MAG: hypothetical protein JXR50_02520 [Prolixibacteraceae bacterium]|nr:hypothetical protein [Prolixibacteraceae bacterium]MBN2648594.1 hypothetical protein [Prolixibacteraceae bacterium]